MTFPTTFGTYELRGLLGRGGMGEVYRALDRQHDRVVALKLLPPALAADAVFAEQFLAECHAAAQLTDPHVVPVHRYGESDGRLFIDMRLVDGADLAHLLASEGSLAPARAVSLVAQAAQALDAAHRAGLVHRDVKPPNLLVTPHDFVYLADFGLAQPSGSSGSSSDPVVVGTFDYMAPERFRPDRPIDARTDVYGLACVLFETVTGRKPFGLPPGPELMQAHLEQPPPRVTDVVPDAPAGLDDVVARGMAKDPAARYPSAGALAAAAITAVQVAAPGTLDVGLAELLTATPAAAAGEAAPATVAVPLSRSPGPARPTGPARPASTRRRTAVMAGTVGLGGLLLVGGAVALGSDVFGTDGAASIASTPGSTATASAPTPPARAAQDNAPGAPDLALLAAPRSATPDTPAPAGTPAPEPGTRQPGTSTAGAAVPSTPSSSRPSSDEHSAGRHSSSAPRTTAPSAPSSAPSSSGSAGAPSPGSTPPSRSAPSSGSTSPSTSAPSSHSAPPSASTPPSDTAAPSASAPPTQSTPPSSAPEPTRSTGSGQAPPSGSSTPTDTVSALT